MITLMREINLNHHTDDMRVGQTCLILMHNRNVVEPSRFIKRVR